MARFSAGGRWDLARRSLWLVHRGRDGGWSEGWARAARVARVRRVETSDMSIRGDDIERGSRLFVPRKQRSRNRALPLPSSPFPGCIPPAASGTFNPESTTDLIANWKLLRPITSRKKSEKVVAKVSLPEEGSPLFLEIWHRISGPTSLPEKRWSRISNRQYRNELAGYRRIGENIRPIDPTRNIISLGSRARWLGRFF